MKINLLRTAYPKKVDYEHIEDVRNQLERENASSEERIKEIFEDIDADIDLQRYLKNK